MTIIITVQTPIIITVIIGIFAIIIITIPIT